VNQSGHADIALNISMVCWVAERAMWKRPARITQKHTKLVICAV
jgi:hypothetical protein